MMKARNQPKLRRVPLRIALCENSCRCCEVVKRSHDRIIPGTLVFVTCRLPVSLLPRSTFDIDTWLSLPISFTILLVYTLLKSIVIKLELQLRGSYILDEMQLSYFPRLQKQDSSDQNQTTMVQAMIIYGIVKLVRLLSLHSILFCVTIQASIHRLI